MPKLLLAIDQGTTGTTALVVSLEGVTLGRATREFRQHFPKPGWVSHDASEIWATVEESVRGALDGGRRARKRHRGHRHHEPARDDRGVGSRRP